MCNFDFCSLLYINTHTHTQHSLCIRSNSTFPGKLTSRPLQTSHSSFTCTAWFYSKSFLPLCTAFPQDEPSTAKFSHSFCIIVGLPRCVLYASISAWVLVLFLHPIHCKELSRSKFYIETIDIYLVFFKSITGFLDSERFYQDYLSYLQYCPSTQNLPQPALSEHTNKCLCQNSLYLVQIGTLQQPFQVNC